MPNLKNGNEKPAGLQNGFSSQLLLQHVKSFLELTPAKATEFAAKYDKHICRAQGGEKNTPTCFFRPDAVESAFNERNAEIRIGYQLGKDGRQLANMIVRKEGLDGDCRVALEMCMMKTPPGRREHEAVYLEEIIASLKSIFGDSPPARALYQIACLKKIHTQEELDCLFGKLNELSELVKKTEKGEISRDELEARLVSLEPDQKRKTHPVRTSWKAIAREMKSIAKTISSNIEIILRHELAKAGFKTIYRPVFKAEKSLSFLLNMGREWTGRFDTITSQDGKSVLAGVNLIITGKDEKEAVFYACLLSREEMVRVLGKNAPYGELPLYGFQEKRYVAKESCGLLEIDEVAGWKYSRPLMQVSMAAEFRALPKTEISIRIKWPESDGRINERTLSNGEKAPYAEAIFSALPSIGFFGTREYFAMNILVKEGFPDYQLRVFRDPPLRTRLFLNGAECQIGKEAYRAFQDRLSGKKIEADFGFTLAVTMPPQPRLLLYEEGKLFPLPRQGKMLAAIGEIEQKIRAIAAPDIVEVSKSILQRIGGLEIDQVPAGQKHTYNMRSRI